MIFVFLLLTDQIFKFLSLRWKVAVINQGIAFGLFPHLNFFSILLIFIFFVVGYLLYARQRNLIWPLKLILVGGLSNFIDRCFRGGVIDYLYFSIIPSFNLADILISIGFSATFFLLFKKDE